MILLALNNALLKRGTCYRLTTLIDQHLFPIASTCLDIYTLQTSHIDACVTGVKARQCATTKWPLKRLHNPFAHERLAVYQ